MFLRLGERERKKKRKEILINAGYEKRERLSCRSRIKILPAEECELVLQPKREKEKGETTSYGNTGN